MKTSCFVGLTSAVTIPTLPVAVDERATGVARVDRGVDLDQALDHHVAVRTWNVRSRPDTTPALSEP